MEHDRLLDPYRACERHCNHDLGHGALISELLGGDGPHPASYLVVNLSPQRARLYDDDLEPIAAREAV